MGWITSATALGRLALNLQADVPAICLKRQVRFQQRRLTVRSAGMLWFRSRKNFYRNAVHIEVTFPMTNGRLA